MARGSLQKTATPPLFEDTLLVGIASICQPFREQLLTMEGSEFWVRFPAWRPTEYLPFALCPTEPCHVWKNYGYLRPHGQMFLSRRARMSGLSTSLPSEAPTTSRGPSSLLRQTLGVHFLGLAFALVLNLRKLFSFFNPSTLRAEFFVGISAPLSDRVHGLVSTLLPNFWPRLSIRSFSIRQIEIGTSADESKC